MNWPLSPQCLYVSLPALLECNPFQKECRESWRASPPLPEELRRIVLIYQAALDLLRQYEVHPEITSQMFAYLFFFSNTLLFNQLLDKGQSSLNTQPGLGNCSRWAFWETLQSIPVPLQGVLERASGGSRGGQDSTVLGRPTTASCCLLGACSRESFNPMSAPSSPPAGVLLFRAQAEGTQSSLEGQFINKLLQPALSQRGSLALTNTAAPLPGSAGWGPAATTGYSYMMLGTLTGIYFAALGQLSPWGRGWGPIPQHVLMDALPLQGPPSAASTGPRG